MLLSGMTEAVAARYYLTQEIRRIASVRTASTSSREITPAVLQAFVAGSEVRIGNMRVAASMVSKVKQLWDIFTKDKGKAWEQFKQLLGVTSESLSSITQKIQHFMQTGKKTLQQIGDSLVGHIPVLKIYLDKSVKFPSINALIEQMVTKLPTSAQKALKAIASKCHSLAEWLDQLLEEHPVLKPLGTLASASVFAYIWFNVMEISWDIPEIIRGFLGGYAFAEILQSLPEASLGLVLGILFPGIPHGLIWNAAMPITVALRVAWLVHKRYATFEHGQLVFPAR